MLKMIRTAFLLVFSLLCVAHAEGRRPLIGITPSYSNNRITLPDNCAVAIHRNNGVAVILPPTDDDELIAQYVAMLDGAIFTGGPDIPPEFYGQKPHPTTSVMDKARFEFDRRFITAFLASNKPAMGICLGMQSSNVYRGGTMFQDIPSLIGTNVVHRGLDQKPVYHPVKVAPDSRLAQIMGVTEARVLSSHHQAVQQLGQGFVAVAHSPDGVVEAIERTDGVFGIFVQWHPDFMCHSEPEHADKLFGALIRAARNNSSKSKPADR